MLIVFTYLLVCSVIMSILVCVDETVSAEDCRLHMWSQDSQGRS